MDSSPHLPKVLLVAFRPVPYHCLSLPLLRHIFLYLGPPLLLPSIHLNLLRLYCPDTHTYTSTRLNIVFPKGSSLCVYRERYALCLPVGYPLPKAYELCIEEGKLRVLQAIAVARSWPGLIEYEDFVYVFGGLSKANPLQCEKFHTTRKKWAVIPHQVAPQHLFTPCLYRCEIYLSCINTQIEVFTPATECFRSVFVACPCSCEESLSFLLEDCLHILTKEGTLLKWRLKKSYAEADYVKFEGAQVQLSCGAPVRMKGSVYWVGVETGHLMRLDLRRKVVKEEESDRSQ